MPNMVSVLIVEDDPAVGTMVRELIIARYAEGCFVKHVSCPLNACELLGVFRPDLLITDYRMPGMNGVELAVQALEKNQSLSILIMTGSFDFDPLESSILERRGIPVLGKPFLPEQVYRWIESTPAFRRHGLQYNAPV